MAAESPLIEARAVRKQYFRAGRASARYFDAVPSSDLALGAGELVEVVGRSGSGKTTLLSMMAGLLRPTEGQVMLEGEDLYAMSDDARSRVRNERFGVIPQGHTPLGDLTVLQNVCLPWRMYRPAADEADRARRLLERLGIGELEQSLPAELSGGELRRMSIARALICEPDVVFADEPTGDLDDENTACVLGLLREVADGGTAVLLVTHEQAAAAYADRTVRMGGR